MGRRDERRLKRMKGESLKKSKSNETSLASFIVGDTKIIPVVADNVKGTVVKQERLH